MSRKKKETGETKDSYQEDLEIKRKKYREWVEKNPYPMDPWNRNEKVRGMLLSNVL